MVVSKLKFGRGVTQPFKNIGLRQLREQRELTTERWSRLGLLDGLVGISNDNIAQLFESQSFHLINEEIIEKPFKFK